MVDRLVDPITPLLEQYSFAGMLDTIFGIGIKNLVAVPEEMLKETRLITDPQELPIKKIQLEAEVYRELIHLNNDDSRSKIPKILSELHKMDDVRS